MFKEKRLSDGIFRVALIALAAFVFIAANVAFENAIFGILASAFYVYEVARI